MTAEEIHSLLTQEFGGSKIVGARTDAIDPWIEVAADAILEVSRFLHDDERTQFDYLNDLCAVDYCEPDPKKAKKFTHEPHLEVVYQLTSITHRHSIRIKTSLPRGSASDMPEIDSVTSVWGIADWHEREAYDMMGIRFKNHPNLRRILCPEDWVGHPLRKDYEFPLEYHGIRGK